MTDAITCPHCRESLDIPAKFRGRPVRCGNCQTVFTPTGDDPPVVARRSSYPPATRARPLDDEDDRPPPRRSNAGVVLLLLLTLFTVGGCCGLINVVALMMYNPQFTPHPSAEGKFRVEFPAENPTSGSVANPLDDTLKGVKVSASREIGEEEYWVKSYPLHAAGGKLPPEEALKQIADAEVQALGVGPEVRREVGIKHDGFDAVDVMAGGGNGLTRKEGMMRVILAGNRVYVVAVTAQQAQPQFWWQRKFFLSFEITDPPPKPEKDDGGKKPDDKK